MDILKKMLVGILTVESRLVISKYKPYIIAVTGSVGKTSTKDAVYDVLCADGVCDSQHICYVRKSEKSLNSEIGLPLTIIGVPNAWHSLSGWIKNVRVGLDLILHRFDYPDCLILEIGADHPGDIRRVTRWLHPDIAVITRVSRTPVHVEFFKSPEEVFEEKAALADAIKPGGSLIVFADDEKTLSLAERVKSRGVSAVSFGLSEKSDVRGSDYRVLYGPTDSPIGMSFNINLDNSVSPLEIKGAIGQSYMYPLLSAAAVAKVRNIQSTAMIKSLSSYQAPKGRMNLIPGLKGSTLIDDTYNSSPDAVSSALETLRDVRCSGSKIAILGDMMELGKYAADEHKKVGRETVNIVRRLFTVGQRSRATAEEAIKAGLSQEAVLSFDSSADAAETIKALIQPGDIVLIKGSQSMRMERVSAALLASPARVEELLVRQEKEWLEKA